MASTLKVFTGGTVGGRDGTAVNAANPIVLPADTTPIEVFVRVVDDVTGDDTGEDTATTLSPSVPTGLLACFTLLGTYVAEPTADAVVACGANRSLFLKRDGYPAPAIYDLSLGDEGFTTGTRVAQGGTITLTPGDTQISADAADIAGATGYEWDISTSATFATYTRSTTVPSAKTFTGLTNGTTYYVRFRGTAATGVGAWSATASAAASTTLVWSDDFNRTNATAVGNGWSGVTLTAASYSALDQGALYSNRFHVGTGALGAYHAHRIYRARTNHTDLVQVTQGPDIARQTWLYIGLRGTLGDSVPIVPPASYGYGVTWYNAANVTANNLRLYRFDNAVITIIAQATITVADGMTVKAGRDGNDLVVYLNGTETLRATDTTYMVTGDANTYYHGGLLAVGNNQGNVGNLDDYTLLAV